MWDYIEAKTLIGTFSIEQGTGAGFEIRLHTPRCKDPLVIGTNYLTEASAKTATTNWIRRHLAAAVDMSRGVTWAGPFKERA